MTLSMHQFSAPIFLKTLSNLSAILDKAASFAAGKKIDPSVLLGYRLTPDMLNLTRQVQIASDHAKRCVARLAGLEAPAYEDTESTFPELKARIDKTAAYIQTVSPAQMEGAETRNIALKLGGQDRVIPGHTYLSQNALPNFFFHVITAYAILRHCGVEIGKGDFLGQI